MTHVYVTQSEQVVERGWNDYRGVEKEGVCIRRVRRGPVCFVLCDSLKLYLAQVKAGTGVREGVQVSV